MYISDYMQTTFFYLEIFLKKLADDQCAPLSKKRSMYISDYMQTTFSYLGRFLKKLADDKCSSITEGISNIMYIKHFTMGLD